MNGSERCNAVRLDSKRNAINTDPRNRVRLAVTMIYLLSIRIVTKSMVIVLHNLSPTISVKLLQLFMATSSYDRIGQSE